jgi:hypothetical protein
MTRHSGITQISFPRGKFLDVWAILPTGETNAFLLMRFQEPGESQIFGITEMPIPERFSPTFDF